jgi:hypothetical protein
VVGNPTERTAANEFPEGVPEGRARWWQGWASPAGLLDWLRAVNIELTLTKREAAAIMRSKGFSNGYGIARSAALQAAEMKLRHAIINASAEDGEPSIGSIVGPCWMIDRDPWESPHFPTRQAAEAASVEFLATYGPEDHATDGPIKLLDHRCRIDGPDEDGWLIHIRVGDGE